MPLRLLIAICCCAASFAQSSTPTPVVPIPQTWDFAVAMKAVAAKSNGRPGVVLHVGDSITYANPYSQWARGGEGRTPADLAVLKWMHSGKDNDLDGWHLARFDHPAEGRSHTACSGLRADELLNGGKRDMPPLAKMLEQYRPQVVVLMIGTNDVTAKRTVGEFRRDLEAIVATVLERRIVPVVSTIPPHINHSQLGKDVNEIIRATAQKQKLPLIDFEAEILNRRPDDWNGTLMQHDDVHPSAKMLGTTPLSPPTAENLRNSGYLLRGWLSLKKIAEVKEKVLDGLPAPAADVPKKAIFRGTPVKVPVTRDTWLSNVGDEADGSNGGAPKLKLKAYQELSLIDIDTLPLKWKTVTGATLHLKLAGPERLWKVGISSLSSEWSEGPGHGYAKVDGASTFRNRSHPKTPWTANGTAYGGDLCSVMFGEGGSLWNHGDASPPDDDGWQVIPIDPRVVRARIAGLSHGFVLFDDTGSEWSRDGETFTFRHFPNRFVHSRESGKDTAPYFTIYTEGADDTLPMAVTGFAQDNAVLPAVLPSGEAIVRWTTPTDGSPGSGVLGFFVRLDGQPVARSMIPVAGAAGEPVAMHLRDLSQKPGAKCRLEIAAVDGAGNVGPTAEFEVTLSNHRPQPLPPKIAPSEIAVEKEVDHGAFIVDELDKLNPTTGEFVPPPKNPQQYRQRNHLWDAATRRVTLHAAKNEFVAYQVVFTGNVPEPKIAVKFPKMPKLRTTVSRYGHVAAKDGPLPDPLVGIEQADPAFPATAKGTPYHVEHWIPHDTEAGVYHGILTLQNGGKNLVIGVTLTVWDFTLPDRLSFLADMNAYGLPGNETGYYRLAHEHRTVLNVVPYSQKGTVTPGWAPKWNGSTLNFDDWDRRFGSLFDGTAFADLPRAGVPLEAFFLPLHENWPSAIDEHYNGSYWADAAFTPEYRKYFVEASKQFAAHVRDRNWNDTLFQCFLNNKVDYKKNGWSRGSSPWLLDEPQSYQDFHALRYFGQAFHEGVSQVDGSGRLVFRADISRPMWQRDSLDRLLDYNVVNGDFRRYRRMVLDRKARDGQIVVEYGSANAIERSNVQALAWSVDAWCLGADGVLPWQTVGTRDAWTKAEETSLFYPPRPGETGPTPSVRLKAFRRGQQDVEYLTILSQVMKEPRWSLGETVRKELALDGKREGTGAAGEDAGIVTYDRRNPADFWALRLRIGEYLSDRKPEAKRKLVDFRTPKRSPR
jgi:GDSL-like Lipase/Acylhydrolase family/Domain of unknown function (DUF4091)